MAEDHTGLDPDEASKSERIAAAPDAQDPFDALVSQLNAAGEYARHFAAAKVDGVRIRVRDLLCAAAAAMGCMIFATTMLVISGLYLAHGLAAGLAIALGNRTWLGDFLTGALGLSVGAMLIWVALQRARASWSSRKREKYELRKKFQRAEFGSDVEQASSWACDDGRPH